MGAGVSAQSAAPDRRMLYVAVHDPVFVPASTASLAQDGDFVIGVAKGKVAKAYHALDLQRPLAITLSGAITIKPVEGVGQSAVSGTGTMQAREIYRSNYWNKLRCDDLPIGVDLLSSTSG